MWLQFALAVIVLVAVLVVPGSLLLRAFGMPWTWAVCLSPVLSTALICIVCQVLSWAGIFATPLTILGPALATALIALLVGRRHGAALSGRRHMRPMALPKMAWWVPCAFAGLGCILGALVWARALWAPGAIFEAWDVTAHMNIIQSFLDSGSFSSLGTSSYAAAADAAIAPVSDVGFYPAAWHCLCALVIQVTGVSVPLVINASTFAFAFVVFPLSMAALLAFVFKGDERFLAVGAVASVSFVAFPWDLLAFGPIYAFVAGLSCLPAVLTLLMCTIDLGSTRWDRARFACLLLVSLVGLALLHSSMVFSLGVFSIFYCADVIWRSTGERGLPPRRRCLLVLAFLAVVGIAWAICYKLPFVRDVVAVNWEGFASPVQELVNILTQTYTCGFIFEISAQVLLGAMVVIGLVRAMYSSRFRWVGLTYLLLCVMVFVDATSEGLLKHLLGGFWYTDPMRLAAMAVVAAMPVAVLGMEWVAEVIQGLVRAYNDPRGKVTHEQMVPIACLAVFLVVNFLPAAYWPGTYAPDGGATSTTHTTFSDYQELVREVNDDSVPLSVEEMDFLDEVKQTVEPDALVLNDPMDGSFLAYGYDGLRVYCRTFRGYEDSTEDCRVIMGGLADLTSDGEVRRAVDNVGARYVLILDSTGSEGSFINQLGEYDHTLFSGVNSITDDTPGFEKVLERGDMRLYRIVA